MQNPSGEEELAKNKRGIVKCSESMFGNAVDRTTEVRVAAIKERPLLTNLSGPQYCRKGLKYTQKTL
jgi:hypothetical protein